MKSLMRTTMTALIVLGFAASAALAQPLNISNTAGVPSVSPRIATDSLGNVHAVWVEQLGGATGDVVYAKGTLATLQIGAAVNLSNSNKVVCDTLEMCSIDVDAQDRLYVVWVERTPGRVQLRVNTAGVWSDAFTVDSGSVYEAPRVAVAPGGDIYIIYWNNEGHLFSRARVGGVWEDIRDVGIWAHRSKMADIAIGVNTVGAAWVDRTVSTAPYQTAYASRPRAYNGAWSETRLVAPMAESHQHPALELDSSDVAHIVWTTVLDEGSGTRVVHYVRTSGGGFTSPVALSQAELLHYPFVTERDGELYVVWQVGGYGGGSSVDYNIRGTDGVWKGAASVPQSSGCTYADVAVTPDRGIAFFVWDKNLGTANAETYGWAKVQAAVNPNIKVGRDRLNFGAVAGGVATSPQSVLVENTGSGAQRWTVGESTAWLTASPLSGTRSGSVQVSVDAAGLSAGGYQGLLQVSDPDAPSFLPKTITVYLTVYASTGVTGSPAGAFDTPLNNANVSSSIAVTGWALDDIETAVVKISRAPVGAEPAGTRVFIGNATFVEGARPDIELAYPSHPFANRAGWGYMLLTNFLPNGGNGTYILYAHATDKEGREVQLGSKTINVNNAAAVKPFGALDTPVQGGLISGAAYDNFGWALTPQPNSIPADGSTIGVWVDGALVGHPSYGHYRDDIATLFPGYANSTGAVGVFSLNTTGYANGLHTIAWSVRDGAGNEDGIGSRYFSILNTGTPAPQAGNLAKFDDLRSFRDVSGAPVYTRLGYDRGLPPERALPSARDLSSPVLPGAGGEPRIAVRELERVEILLDDRAWSLDVERRALARAGLAPAEGPTSRSAAGNWEGYLVVGDELRALPIGSSLDSGAGVFSWLPGPGFLGDYRLVFVDRANRTRSSLTVRIGIR